MLALSSPSELDRIATAAAKIEERGFRVKLAANIASRATYLAGDDDVRLSSFHSAIHDDSIRAIFFARGGYGLSRILDRIDFRPFEKDPRPVVGFSDVTALHQALAAKGFASFHGPMLNSDFFDNLSPDHEEWLWQMLEGAAEMRWTFDDTASVIAEGSATGMLFGGCLSLTAALHGTPFDFWKDDGIWFWEEVGEPTYRIDRMLTTLRLSGRFDRLRGVLIGRLMDCGKSNPEELDRLLENFFGDLGIPVVRDLPFGHFGDNLTLPIGAPAMIDTTARVLHFPESLVSFGPA